MTNEQMAAFDARLAAAYASQTIRELREALRQIANHPHNDYRGATSYDIGVADGHKCAAGIAVATLKETP